MTARRVPALAVATVSLVGVLTACSSSSPAAKTPTGSGAASASTTSVASTRSSATASLQRWYVAARPSLDRVDNAIIAAQKAVDRHDASALHDACLSLQHSVHSFAAVAPAPDRRVRVSIHHANVNFNAAAVECLAGDLTTAGPSVLRGQSAVTAAARRIDTLT